MKKRVFITGATGNMGWAVLQDFLQKLDRFDITVLARKSEKNQKKLAPYLDRIRVEWGDLNRYEDVLRGTNGADYVLHMGGMVSPSADYFPNRTRHVNVTAAQNVVNAVLAQPNADDIRVCYVGTVAQTSDRVEPIHWGRTGDPIFISVYDCYAISKTIAERVFVESGIKHWVSLRQSGLLYPKILKNYDPIMFHVPLRGALEWTTLEDSTRAMVNLCEDWVPDEFWNHFYNIGSGPEYRLSNYEFLCHMLHTIHCPRPEKIFNPEWFVLRNFHGMWYEDSDKLENYLHFRGNVPVKDYFRQMGKKLPWFFSLARIVPPVFIKWAMRPMAYKPKWGTQWWVKNDPQRVAVYYGSIDRYRAIKTWKDVDTSRPSDNPIHLNHGYDETKPRTEWTIDDMREAAAFRGGKCLSDDMIKGDYHTPLEWECQFGHKFKASPVLILEGGHWCPECLPTPWNYDEIAKNNPFIAQVWTDYHKDDVIKNDFGEEIFANWEGDSKY